MTHPLIGTWTGNAFPTQETSIIFFKDGQGLLFFYLGSHGPALLNEFTWKPLSEKTIHVEWIVKDDYDYESDEDEEDDEAHDGDEEAEPDEKDDAVYPFSVTEQGLVMQLGMHEFEYALRYAGLHGNFEEDKIKWTDFTKTFNPFGDGRKVWTVSADNSWQKTNLSVTENKPWWKFW